MLMRSSLTIAVTGAALLAALSGAAHAIPIPDVPTAARGGAKPHHHSGPASPKVTQPTAGGVQGPPPPSPFQVRLRTAPPGRGSQVALGDGQVWSISVVGGAGFSCNGALQLKKDAASASFNGDAAFACSDGAARFDFHRAMALIQVGSSVVANFTSRAKDPRAPEWQALNLVGETPGRMTGALSDGTRTAAVTLTLAQD